VTRRRELEREIEDLRDIRSILDAMRNLAFMEVRKLERALASMQRALATTERALADVAACCAPHEALRECVAATVVIGSERGLCGDYNDTIARAVATAGGVRLIGVGARLGSRLKRRAEVLLSGAGITEDVDTVIATLAARLEATLRVQAGAWRIEVVSMRPGAASTITSRLEPFPQGDGPPAACPRVQLAPRALLDALSGQYLLSRLRELLCSALLAENEHRLRHMDAAVRNIDERSSGLEARRNALRQEEITQEIEIIMLSRPASQRGA
jgi:F-type H+-transporting ATPase subunit gamma